MQQVRNELLRYANFTEFPISSRVLKENRITEFSPEILPTSRLLLPSESLSKVAAKKGFSVCKMLYVKESLFLTSHDDT
jgi:hypothetical protein